MKKKTESKNMYNSKRHTWLTESTAWKFVTQNEKEQKKKREGKEHRTKEQKSENKDFKDWIFLRVTHHFSHTNFWHSSGVCCCNRLSKTVSRGVHRKPDHCHAEEGAHRATVYCFGVAKKFLNFSGFSQLK